MQPAASHAPHSHRHPDPHATGQPKLYNPRHPEQSLLYRTVAEHFESWLELASAGQFDGQGDHHTPPAYVEQAFRKYLECGIFAHGFARARCDGCGHDFFIAFSCKGRGVCPSCNTRRMAETAAHLADHVFPRLPVRQWVLSVPKRLRYFLQRNGAVLNTALRIFLRVIQRSLHAHSPSAAQVDPASVRIGAVAFIHRFGSSLNSHVHFHVCVIDGVFEADEGTRFHPASGLDEAAIEQAQADVRRRVLRAFVSRGLIEKFDAQEMLAYSHSGFSVDAGVCIAPADRAGLERLLRYCARPPFAMDRLRQRGAELVYHCPKPQAGGKRSDLVLTPLELIDRIAALVPPPRTHRHRYFGVLAPNSPLRAGVTALAQMVPVQVLPEPVAASGTLVGVAEASVANAKPNEPVSEPVKWVSAHYLWAALMARIFEVFPLVCPLCGGSMRLIAFITQGAEVRKILEHIGVDPQAPRITPARGPPLWDACDAQGQDGEGVEPDEDVPSQLAPDDGVDQRTGW